MEKTLKNGCSQRFCPVIGVVECELTKHECKWYSKKFGRLIDADSYLKKLQSIVGRNIPRDPTRHNPPLQAEYVRGLTTAINLLYDEPTVIEGNIKKEN